MNHLPSGLSSIHGVDEDKTVKVTYSLSMVIADRILVYVNTTTSAPINVEVESTPESRSRIPKQVPTIVKLGYGGPPMRTRLTNTIMMVKETQVRPLDPREIILKIVPVEDLIHPENVYVVAVVPSYISDVCHPPGLCLSRDHEDQGDVVLSKKQ